MLKEITKKIKQTIGSYSTTDQLVFQNQVIPIQQGYFTSLVGNGVKKITFIDGGQAEILSAANFCLGFVRLAAATYQGITLIDQKIIEFYVFVKAVYHANEIYYQSTLFPVTGKLLFSAEDLFISSHDSTIKNGTERAALQKVVGMARRFGELALAASFDNEIVVLDGTLDATYKNENKFLSLLSEQVSALAKSSSLFTISGNSPMIFLNKIGPENECWSYFVTGKTYFVKLHPIAKHIFRFTGRKDVLSSLVKLSSDAVFLGYPYGLSVADKLARVSNAEKSSLQMQFLLKEENKDIVSYLSTQNVHDILDRLG